MLNTQLLWYYKISFAGDIQCDNNEKYLEKQYILHKLHNENLIVNKNHLEAQEEKLEKELEYWFRLGKIGSKFDSVWVEDYQKLEELYFGNIERRSSGQTSTSKS